MAPIPVNVKFSIVKNVKLHSDRGPQMGQNTDQLAGGTGTPAMAPGSRSAA